MKLLLLEAGYGRVYRFRYPRYKVDETPRVLFLAKYRHRTTRKPHLAGINLNYLSQDEVEDLRNALSQILAAPQKRRYDVGMRLVPHIFGKYYRTYLQSDVIPIDAETLRKVPSPEERAKYIERAKKAAATRAARAAQAEREAERLTSIQRRREYD